MIGRFAAALLLSAPIAAAAGVYKWVDRDGVTHYDDSSRIGERLSRTSIANRYIAVDPRATAPEELVRELADACRDTRERRRIYENATALYGRDSFGNTYPLSDTQVRIELATLQRDAGRYCRENAADKLLAEIRAGRLAAEKRKPVEDAP